MTDKMVTIFGVAAGLILAGIGAANPALRGEDVPQAEGHAIFSGRWTAGFGSTFDKQLPLREAAVDGWTAATYTLFREGREGVLVGIHDWLYTSEEFDAPRISAGVAETLHDVRAANAALSARGIRLIVAVVPAKARIYPENLGRYRWPQAQKAIYDQLILGLRAEGVAAVDLRPTLTSVKGRELAYFRTDTHWTPAGAEAAAQTLAAQIRAGSLLATPETVKVAASNSPAVAMDGDLMNFIPLGTALRGLGPKPDRLAQPVFTRADSDAAASGGGLLGDTATPVILVGSSYSADERWGFADYLSKDLGVDVVNASEKGQGPFVPMQNLLAGTALNEAQPQLVVWEIPERYIWMKTMKTAGSVAKQ